MGKDDHRLRRGQPHGPLSNVTTGEMLLKVSTITYIQCFVNRSLTRIGVFSDLRSLMYTTSDSKMIQNVKKSTSGNNTLGLKCVELKG